MLDRFPVKLQHIPDLHQKAGKLHQAQVKPLCASAAVLDMKFPHSASTATKKPSSPRKNDVNNDMNKKNSLNPTNNNVNMSSQQRKDSNNNINPNNTTSTTTTTMGVEVSRNTKKSGICWRVESGTSNINQNMNNTTTTSSVQNDNHNTGLDLGPVHSDSGACSSGSEEDKTSCLCGEASPGRSRHGQRRPSRKLVISRSMSWSSLDSGVGGANLSPSASSMSSMSSLWSLASSSRTNLSYNPSLDSLAWGTSDSSDATQCEQATPAVLTVSGSSSPADYDLSCETKGSNITPNSSKKATSSRTSALTSSNAVEESEDDVASASHDSMATRHNIYDAAVPNSIPNAVLQEADLASRDRVRTMHAPRRQHRTRRDQNNNTGMYRGNRPQAYLPHAPGRLGDCFSRSRQGGVLAFIALIVYTIMLMSAFSVLGLLGEGVKAVVGKQDLKEMRKSLAQSRRSRRAPATSG